MGTMMPCTSSWSSARTASSSTRSSCWQPQTTLLFGSTDDHNGMDPTAKTQKAVDVSGLLPSCRFGIITSQWLANLLIGSSDCWSHLGIADDDLRETAYEILVAAAGASGGHIVPKK